MHSEFQQMASNLVTELQIGFQSVRDEFQRVRDEFQSEFKSVRDEFQSEFQSVRDDIQKLRKETQEEFRSVREDIKSLRQDIRAVNTRTFALFVSSLGSVCSEADAFQVRECREKADQRSRLSTFPYRQAPPTDRCPHGHRNP